MDLQKYVQGNVTLNLSEVPSYPLNYVLQKFFFNKPLRNGEVSINMLERIFSDMEKSVHPL